MRSAFSSFYSSLPGLTRQSISLQKIHFAKREERWIRGSSPRMTLNIRLIATFIRKRPRIVFCALQNPRHHAAADELPDRRRSCRHHLAGHAMGIAWPQAHDRLGRAARDMRVFAAWKSPALPAGTAFPALGRGARRA